MEQTSISDNNRYPAYCYSASKNDAEFVNFKQNPIYRRILEHVPPQQGSVYLEKVLENKELHLSIQDWEYILRNDSIGNPDKAQYSIVDLKFEPFFEAEKCSMCSRRLICRLFEEQNIALRTSENGQTVLPGVSR